MSLPAPWVDRIFEKLTLTYGHRFLGRWSGLDLGQVKADWAHELARLQQSPDAIRYALNNLPPAEPPTVLEFRAICARRPAEVVALPAPSPEGIRRIAATLNGATIGGVTLADLLAHHRQLRAEGRQSPCQRDWLRAVEAKAEVGPQSVGADFRPIDVQSLPPGMREAA